MNEDSKIFLALAISFAVSLYLCWKILARPIRLKFKLALCLVILIPFLGPIFYALLDPPPPQDEGLQNHGMFGNYFHDWMSIRDILKKDQNKESSRISGSNEADE